MYVYILQLTNKFWTKTVLNMWVADIKEMYDWLPQSAILKSSAMDPYLQI